VTRSEKTLRDVLEEAHWVAEMPASVRERVLEDAYETFFQSGQTVIQKGEPARAASLRCGRASIWFFTFRSLLQQYSLGRRA